MKQDDPVVSRRSLLTGLSGLSLAAMVAPSMSAASRRGTFPKGFRWGAATAADQIEGNNINSDFWLMYRAISAGTPVLGYLHWSLLDNFEWARGYEPHFGLVSVDRSTFKRTPKASSKVLGAIA
jgi:beta-glucosidase/6-phospho-beta-glucosidase/beta-galactosidase